DGQGLRGLVLAKFLPGLGSVVAPLAGALGVSATRFLLLDSLGSFLYAGCYIGAGILLHNQLQQVLAGMKQLWLRALLLALFSVAAYITCKYVQKQAVIGRTCRKTTEIRRKAPRAAIDRGRRHPLFAAPS